MPKGYAIASIDVSDSEKYRHYVNASTAVVAKFNGRFLVRAGECMWMEGGGNPRQVVIEFDSYDDALNYYHSDEYQKAIKLRESVAIANVVIVAGVG